MELADSPDEARFRAEVREWAETAVATLPWPEPVDLVDKVPFWRQWQQLLFEAGYGGMSWPQEYGGQAADPIRKAIFTEEMDRVGAPERLNTIGEDFAGPTIIDFGTPAQKERFLRPILTGEEIWCQLFSEPEAGSDLASLRTKATKVDGGWKINGQKIWTSRAHIAAHAILLARTGGGPRHKGITFFLVPMDSEGITVRPLAHMLGEAEFNEVFLDDVFIPDDLVVGDVDGGWKVAMGTLAYERVAIATGRVNTKRAVDDIVGDIAEMTDESGRPLGADPLIRQKVADLYGRALVHYLIGQRVITLAANDGPPGPVTSIGKLFFCPLVEELADFRLSLEPAGGQFALDDEQQRTSRWLRLAYQARGTAIAGGSTFIQRNIVAERMLEMPRS
ncbi:Acyl-CoA dehydrogenase [Rhodococcus rhodochrous J3]|uniref:Alkylation response protein AidB-like acyl-CoA dehydrogenase n=3 Tax=Rhodococcus TaxID=1827 RepID=A0A562E3E2_RHORH|nr:MULTISPECIES: acyl-CoA dehydrogenase family protein [Rhodococcus]MBF4478152.1 acyl-CoA dehydrogenase family protein [Rhodococcus rhodochrous]MCB8913857.1 acyl-CoA dehydrogenase family protein [Rhodococcus rhodochrous]MCD2099771.1 acyl-CoA dehydrogenase family protein [Rhodococcus rhodochrous]MCD2124065.1 acyl-CoA dehydrogenase family protein [Rhodococcus rhodochrous]MCQ4136850.1 acyl-CoA dehydrogenase family protein [Rhodococcus rhodochrous]